MNFMSFSSAGVFDGCHGVRLGVTGSAVGKSVARLESKLGVQLLHRTTQKVALTTEGEAYLQTCRKVIEDREQQAASLATGHQQPIGQLRVDPPTTFGRRHLMHVLLELSRKYERLSLAISMRDRAVDLVSEGIDLSVRIGTLGDHPDLIARSLGEQQLIICGSPEYLRRRDEPKHRSDLKDHDFLVGWYRGTRPVWQMCFAAGHTEPFDIKPKHELTKGDALLSACLMECGLAQLPFWLAESAICGKNLVPVLQSEPTIVMPINVVWQKT
ncbi:LysR family transcriptional regulator [Robbsia andropogonis]|uniref:LysR family transcriptional regulator n=1 Tax=Robbsia andropogonis TaxID=28092 RepID=UPI0009DD8527|nr:LysR family transcriptional regulator [Robbsia andropogonis]